jgi:hypothetical protein
MSYRNKDCENYTSVQIQSWIETTEFSLQQTKKNNGLIETIKQLELQLDDLRADLILKKQEENKEEMKQLLNRLLQIVESK